METDLQKVSVYISLILRHKPEICGISLDLHGWANVQELIDGINRSGKYQINEDILQQIVETDEKQRYRFNNDKTLIRANQGHSIPVDVELFERMPLDILYHGTAEKYLQSIYACGLLPQSRLYVHLSSNAETAQTVGARHGKPVVFIVFSKKLWEKGQKFYLSDNGIWLTDRITVEYIDRMQDIETTE